MTKTYLNNIEHDFKIPLEFNNIFFRTALMRELAFMNMLLADVKFDGREADFYMGQVKEFSRVDVTAREYRKINLNKNVELIIDGKETLFAYDNRINIFELVSMCDRELFSKKRRIKRIVLDGLDGSLRENSQRQAGEFSKIEFATSEISTIKKAVVTLCVGSFFDLVKPHVYGAMKDYAKKCDADFIAIEDSILRMPYPHFEKYRIAEILNEYDQVLYVDSDVVINNKLAPRIFEQYNLDEVGMFNEEEFCTHLHERNRAINQVGKIDWTKYYFNNGVFIVSYMHKPLFHTLPDDLIICQFMEQTMMNYRLFKYKFKFKPLDCRFNYMGICGNKFDEAYFIHFAGTDLNIKNEKNEKMSKLEVIKMFAQKVNAHA